MHAADDVPATGHYRHSEGHQELDRAGRANLKVVKNPRIFNPICSGSPRLHCASQVLFLQEAITGTAKEFQQPTGLGAPTGLATQPEWCLVNGVWSLFLAFGLVLTSLLVRQVGSCSCVSPRITQQATFPKRMVLGRTPGLTVCVVPDQRCYLLLALLPVCQRFGCLVMSKFTRPNLEEFDILCGNSINKQRPPCWSDMRHMLCMCCAWHADQVLSLLLIVSILMFYALSKILPCAGSTSSGVRGFQPSAAFLMLLGMANHVM